MLYKRLLNLVRGGISVHAGRHRNRAGRIRLLAVYLLAVSGTTVLVRWYRWNYVPVAYPTARIPDAERFGHPEEAIRLSAQLLDEMRRNGWDDSQVPFSHKLLPDRYLSERWDHRSDRMTTFGFPQQDNPVYDRVAFATDLYSRTNPAFYHGDKVKTKPSGFYIVGWKDGRVTTVPIGDVRLFAYGDGQITYVYPGMKEWRQDGWRLQAVEFADGNANTVRGKAYYAALKPSTDKPDCPSCKK